MKKCYKCGAELHEEAVYCPVCGFRQDRNIRNDADQTQAAGGAQNAFRQQAAAGTQTDFRQQTAAGSTQAFRHQQAAAGTQTDFRQQAAGSTEAGTGTHRSAKPGKEKVEDCHPEGSNDVMIGILSYVTMIGWIVAFIVSTQDANGRSRYAVFHLNQGLVLWLFAFLGLVPVIGIIWRIVILIFSVIAFIGACQSEARKVPLLGGIHILKK